MDIIYALGSALFAGVTAVLAKYGIKNTDSTVATAIRTIGVLLFAWLMVLITNSYQEITMIKTKTIVFLALSGVATGASWLCYFKALQLGNVNKVVPIDKSSTILTMILAFVFLHETITLIMFIGMILMGIGTFLMIEKKDIEHQNEKFGWLIFAIFSAIFASLNAILGKVGIKDIDSNLGTAIRTGVVLVMAWIMVFVTNKQSTIKTIDKKNLLFICLSALTTGASWLLYYRALQIGNASVVVPIDKLSIVVTMVFSYFVLKEKFTKKVIIGLILIVLGTFALLF